MIDLNNSLVLKHQKNLSEISVMEFTGMLSRAGRAAIGLNVGNKIEPSSYVDYLNKTIMNIENIQVEPETLQGFFSQVYTSPLVDESNFAIAFRSDEDIEKIRPEYLSVISSDVNNTIRKILAGTEKETDIKKMIISGEYENKLKKQLVKTTLRLNGTRDLLILDSPPIVKIDKFFIQNNIIPFLSSYKQNTEELITIARKAIGRINDLTNSLNLLFNALSQSIQSGKIPDNKLNLIAYYVFNMKTISMRLCAYITSMIIRKMAFYSFNVTACVELYNGLSEMFPEMEKILHESVMDGDLTDVDNDTLMQSIINGSLNVIRPHVQKVVGMKKLEVSNAMSQKFNKKIDFIAGFDIDNKHPYDSRIYSAINASIIEIINNLHTFEILSKDSEAVVDDIIEESSLSETFITKYHKIISRISDISYYSMDGDEDGTSDMTLSLFNDILHYENNMDVIVGNMSKCYHYLNELIRSFDVNNYNLQDESYNELKSFLDTTMKNYKEYLIRIIRNLLERLDNMTEALSFTSILPKDDNAFDNTQDYSLESYAEAYDDRDHADKLVFESLMRQYKQEKAFKERGARLVYEETQTPTTTTTTNKTPEPTVKTDAQQQHTNNENGNTQDNNNQNTNNNGTDQNKKSIIERFKEFIEKVLQKFREKSKRLTDKNNKWLASIKNDLLALDTSNTKIAMAPYSQLIPETILADISSASSKISTLNESALPAELKSPGAKAEFFLFNRIPEKVGNEKSFPGRIKRYYMYGNTAENTLAVYTGEDAKRKIEEMINYCEKYGTVYVQISDALKKLGESASKKQNEITLSSSKTQDEQNSIYSLNCVITGATRDYTGGILTVLEKKYSDYIKVLSKLAPKKDVQPDSGDGNGEESQNESKQDDSKK